MEQPEMDPGFTDNEQLFERENNPGFVAGFWYFLVDSRKWWLLPPLILLLVLGALFALAQTAAAPFIYTLF